ncbi:MAG: hypothetical protein FE036_01575 [Thermoplasmata archaeon]|nr:MAG: hypothetical protein FE036_01575 [Thermoplasmata archaeon]
MAFHPSTFIYPSAYFYVEFEICQIARYPFIEDAKNWVKKEKIDIQEVLYEPIYERARARAVERVEQALKYGVIKEKALLDEIECMMEIFSYPLARLIVAAVESEYLVRRYALAEAKKAYESLKKEKAAIIQKIAREFGIEAKDGMVHFSDYLKFAPTWDIKWKLVNRVMDKGYVELSNDEICRLIQEAIRSKIQNELFYMFAPPDINKIFGELISKLKNKLLAKEIKKVEGISEKDYPPCIKNLIAAIKSGMNVPHVGRFTLVTFLNAIGASTEDILKIFSSSPDFNEEKTRYQIEHITGKISGTVYAPPKCATIGTWGLCFPDELCKKANHPLLYYRLKRRKNELSKEKIL